MLDYDLAKLYAVETKYLNRQVKRNLARFPREYMFQLTQKEKEEVVTNWHHLRDLKFSHQLPFAFTEHGVAMLSAVLNSGRAVGVSIYIINTFIKLRQLIYNSKLIESKLFQLENKVGRHDTEIGAIIKVLKKLIAKPEKPKGKIGFVRGRE